MELFNECYTSSNLQEFESLTTQKGHPYGI